MFHPVGEATRHQFRSELGTRYRGLSTTHPGRLYPRQRAGTHFTGGWVGPKPGLDWYGISRPSPGYDPRTVKPV